MTVADWWGRRSRAAQKRLMIQAGAVALGVIVGFLVVAKLTWGASGPGLVTPFAFFGLFLAAVILFAVTVASSEELVDELEASRPPRVRKRGVVPRAVRQAIAAFGRAVLAWLMRIGLSIRRAIAREHIARRWRVLAEALSGVPPAGVYALHAGPLAQPAPRSTAVDEPLPGPRRSLPSGRDALDRLERLYRRRPQRRVSRPRPPAERASRGTGRSSTSRARRGRGRRTASARSR